MTSLPPELESLLEDAQTRGALGPAPVAVHAEHARGFIESAHQAEFSAPGTVADLGSGGGIPGLVVAGEWPDAAVTLIDSQKRRVKWLDDAIERLGWGGRVTALHGRAEECAKQPDLREAAEVVTARGFGPPAVTAECAAGLVSDGGVVVVSEPPDADPARWPESGLVQLALRVEKHVTSEAGYHFVVLRKTGPLSQTYPRRVGMPAKRPLW